ncbi:uncharacterized protein [Ptychodera flava]|uniref:uncharacterized protein isoform X2 n=1 Tax=Ptychodera flava TaxID=63121 RepID=UPI00396A5B02
MTQVVKSADPVKLDTERDVSTAGSGQTKSGAGSQLHLQHALSRRQALLNQLRAEQSEMNYRPRSYGGNYRRNLTPIPTPRSLPDNQNIYNSMPQRQIVEHVIRNESKRTGRGGQMGGGGGDGGLYFQSLGQPQQMPQNQPTIIQQLPAPQQNPAALIQQIPPPQAPSNTKQDMMEMMMIQNAQMHQIIMQQMMLSSIPKSSPFQQTASVPVVAAAAAEPQILTFRGSRHAQPVHHFYHPMPRAAYPLPPLDSNRIPQHPTGPQEVEPLKAPRKKVKSVTPEAPKKRRVEIPFPGNWAVRKLRQLFYMSWFSVAAKRAAAKRKHGDSKEVFLFGIMLKEAVSALHRIFLDEKTKVHSILEDILNTNVDFYITSETSAADEKQIIQELTYIIENLSYQLTEIMPAAGVLGTHKKAAVYEMIQEGVQFPSGYFYGVEMQLLDFDQVGRNMNMTDQKAYMMLVMLFFARSLVATLFVRPVDYGLIKQTPDARTSRNLKVVGSLILYLSRKASMPEGSKPMQMPVELKDYMYADDDISYLLDKLKKPMDYAEGLVREWGEEYVKRLNNAE